MHLDSLVSGFLKQKSKNIINPNKKFQIFRMSSSVISRMSSVTYMSQTSLQQLPFFFSTFIEGFCIYNLLTVLSFLLFFLPYLPNK